MELKCILSFSLELFLYLYDKLQNEKKNIRHPTLQQRPQSTQDIVLTPVQPPPEKRVQFLYTPQLDLLPSLKMQIVSSQDFVTAMTELLQRTRSESSVRDTASGYAVWVPFHF